MNRGSWRTDGPVPPANSRVLPDGGRCSLLFIWATDAYVRPSMSAASLMLRSVRVIISSSWASQGFQR